MMARYVDIDDIIKTFEKLHGEESALLNCYNADWIVSFLEAQPAADVAEGVRCKDCKHLNPMGSGGYRKCLRDNLWKDTDDFCSRGERKKEDGEIY